MYSKQPMELVIFRLDTAFFFIIFGYWRSLCYMSLSAIATCLAQLGAQQGIERKRTNRCDGALLTRAEQYRLPRNELLNVFLEGRDIL